MSHASRTSRSPEELWAELEALPEHLSGQIIDGELYVQPRPRPRHSRVILKLGTSLGSFDFGANPGGWWILIEPGIELPGAPEIVPDLAGWRRTTLPELDLDAPLRTRPDWACEVLSPSNTRLAITKKQAVYARAGVEWLWHVNPSPDVRTLQVFQRVREGWLLQKTASEDETPRLPPFEELEFPLANLWL